MNKEVTLGREPYVAPELYSIELSQMVSVLNSASIRGSLDDWEEGTPDPLDWGGGTIYDNGAR